MSRTKIRPVVAFDKLTGAAIGRWDCPGDASREMGVSESSIISQAKLRAMPQGWTAFRFEGDGLFGPGEGFEGRRCRPVLCHDGKAVVAFASLAEAGTAIGGSDGMVKCHCMSGEPIMFDGRDVTVWLPDRPAPELSLARRWRSPKCKNFR